MASNLSKFDDVFHQFGDDEDIMEDESLDFDAIALEMERKVEMKPDRMETTDEIVIQPSEDSLPSYLSVQNRLFNQIMSTYSIDIEELRQIAHLVHQFNATKLFLRSFGKSILIQGWVD